MSRKKKYTPKKSKKRSHKRLFLSMLGLILLLGVFAGIYLLNGIKDEKYGEFPAYSVLRKIEQAEATEIFTHDGKLMGRYYYENRNSISYQNIPDDIINALVSTEDSRFYEHRGIDIKSLFRVLFKTIILGDRSSGGGSTITQQLAKNLYPRRGERIPAIIGAKAREMILARRLENLYSKDKIIQLYLNTVPFGENTFGVKNASQLYFGVTPDKLTQNQAATLVGMLKATNTYNPHKNPEKAIKRRNIVLSQMTKYNDLKQEQKDSLSTLPLKTNYQPSGQNDGIAPYFREHLRQFMKDWCSNNTKPNGEPYNLYTDGLKIYTTIHSAVQKSAKKAVLKHMPELQSHLEDELKNNGTDDLEQIAEKILQGDSKNSNASGLDQQRPMEVFTWEGPKVVEFSPVDSLKHYLKLLQTGFVAMEPASGNILAWIGGISHKYFKYDHVLSKRQMGSVFKPIVYTKALQQGVELCDYYPNDSLVYEDYDNWTPANADKKYGGVYSVQGALTNSVNTVSVQLLMEAGIDSVRKLAKQMGISDKMPYVPSIALGTTNASVLEMAKAYGVYANDGKKVEPKFILSINDNKGNILESFTEDSINQKVLVSENITEKLILMLNNVTKKGTGRSLYKNFTVKGEIAGKTGTTQDHSDGWFVGFSPNLVFSCWVGADYPGIHFQNINYGQGAASALPVAGYFLQNLNNNNLNEYFGHFSYTSIDTAEFDCDDYRKKAPGIIEKMLGINVFKKDKKDDNRDKNKGIVKKFLDIFKKKEGSKDK